MQRDHHTKEALCSGRDTNWRDVRHHANYYREIYVTPLSKERGLGVSIQSLEAPYSWSPKDIQERSYRSSYHRTILFLDSGTEFATRKKALNSKPACSNRLVQAPHLTRDRLSSLWVWGRRERERERETYCCHSNDMILN